MNPDTIDTRVSIKRSDSGSGIDDLFGYGTSDVENVGKVEVVSNDLMPVIDEFKSLFGKSVGYIEDYKTDTILYPFEINQFLQLTNRSVPKEYIDPTGNLVSKLIQNSYNSGNNNFTFYLFDRPRLFNFNRLIGKYSNTIKINFEGNLSNNCFFKSENIDVTINGEVGYGFGFKSKNITANINGRVGRDFGHDSINLEASIKGDIVFGFGICANNFIAHIDGNIDSDQIFINAKNSVIKMSDVNLINKISNYVENKNKCNYKSLNPTNAIFLLHNWSYNKLVQISEDEKEKTILMFKGKYR